MERGKIYRNFTEKVHCVYAYLWGGFKTCYVGRTKNLHDRHLSHCRGLRHSDGTVTYDSVYLFCKKNNVQIPSPIILENGLTAEESLEREHYWVEQYKELGWALLNKAKTGVGSGSLGHVQFWNYETCKEECTKYTTRSELKTNAYGCYEVCLENGWLDEFITAEGKRPNGYWLKKENVLNEAKKYKTISEFIKGSIGAYKSAKVNGWLDELPFRRDKKELDYNKVWKYYEQCGSIKDTMKYYSIGYNHLKAEFEKMGKPFGNKQSSSRIRKSYEKHNSQDFVVPDWKIEKYPKEEGYRYKAVAKDGDFSTYDFMNNGGHLTAHIKKLGIAIPSLYNRRLYYQMTGNYWWEQWFDIVKEKEASAKCCPYCSWETTDIENKSGAFEQHLKQRHSKTVEDYLAEHPNDIDYFPKFLKREERRNKLSNDFVECPVCKQRFEKLTNSHLLTHGLTMAKFRELFPNAKILSNEMERQTNEMTKLSNLTVSKERFVSKYERELQNFLSENNVKFSANRQILIGKEIDILIEDRRIGIEFDGLKWHTEWFGKKNHSYHLDKTIACNEKGYGLIHIFEDEYVSNKDLVYAKLSHILQLDNNLPKVMGRKCVVREIYMNEAKGFLTKYHIQGFVSSTVYLGAFYDDRLVGVMTFKNGNLKNPHWELTRFATDYHFRFQGLGSKMFTYFVRKYRPIKVVSFADRRWTLNPQKNLYTNLGFTLDSFTKPDYRYYSDDSKNGNKFRRIHKMTMNKKMLGKKYGFPLTMTETEMIKELGYDRIWDCGLIKYIWAVPTI